MTTQDRMLTLVQRLYAKTQSGEMIWERTSRSGVFQVALPNYVVKLSTRSTGPDEPPDYVVSIVDESGNLIERTTDLELSKVFPNEKVFSTMEELYEMSRRQALGVDRALDAILSDLG